jgi:hypothetical protein
VASHDLSMPFDGQTYSSLTHKKQLQLFMARIFLSFSFSDQDLARKLEFYLHGLGHTSEIKVDKPPAGRWRERLSKALNSADVIIPLLSDRGLQSNYVASEIGSGRVLAQSKNALLLPIIISSTFMVPSFISDYHCFKLELDDDGQPEEDRIKALAAQLSFAISEHLETRSPRLFVSHRHLDEGVVKALVSLLERSFEIKSGDIRCTSVHPYRLSPGDRTSEKLKTEIKAAEVVLGILSPEAQDSKYVLAELGAAWGCDVPTFPLLIRGASYTDVPSPLDERSCLDLRISANCIQCVEAMSRVTTFKRRQATGDMARIQEAVEELTKLASAIK